MARCDLAEVGVAVAEVAQGGGLALPVAGLPGDGQRLLVQVDGPGGLARARRSRCRGCPGRRLRLPVAGLAGDGQRLVVQVDGAGGTPRATGSRSPRLVVLAAFGPGVGEVAVQPFVQLGGEPVVAPLDQVVEVDAEQDLGGGVVVAAVVAQLELGQLRGQVIQGLPVLARGAGLLEVVGAAVPQRLPGERRAGRRPGRRARPAGTRPSA